MHITITRSGGVAGLIMTKLLDTASLSSKKARFLDKIISSCNFFSMDETGTQKNNRDHFIYRIVIEDNEKMHSIMRDERELGKLKKLVKEVF